MKGRGERAISSGWWKGWWKGLERARDMPLTTDVVEALLYLLIGSMCVLTLALVLNALAVALALPLLSARLPLDGCASPFSIAARRPRTVVLLASPGGGNAANARSRRFACATLSAAALGLGYASCGSL